MEDPVQIEIGDWLAAFQKRAVAAGIDPSTATRALEGLRLSPDVIAKDKNQPEFSQLIWQYLDRAVSAQRVSDGRQALAANETMLRRIEKWFAVDRHVLVAIWGLESNYGELRGGFDVISSLASLAFDGRRRALFEGELLAALEIIDAGLIGSSKLQGSWAGAMGHTQFMPTSFQKFAMDFDGDGISDIWSDDPTDALASTAAYLTHHGWIPNGRWGCEVRLKDDFDFAMTGKAVTKPVRDWIELGAQPVDGFDAKSDDVASIILPVGWRGPALMIFQNFNAILTYNASDHYVIAVGYLADRLRGVEPFEGKWPRDISVLNLAEISEIQERLARAGYDTQGADGFVGPNTIRAIRGFQVQYGMVPDGFASSELLEDLRKISI